MQQRQRTTSPTSSSATTTTTGNTTGTTNLTGQVDTKTALRVSTLGTLHSLETTVGSVVLLVFAPSKSAHRGSVPLSRLSLFPASHTTMRDAPALNYDNLLNLYDSTSRSGQSFTYSFFTDAAGTQPAGTATLQLPTSTDTYPHSTTLQFNVTGGTYPGTGSGSLTYVSADTINITGKIHLNNDALDAQLTLNATTDANGKSTVSGSGSIVTNSVNVQLSNFALSTDGNTASATMVVKPGNYTGTIVIASDSNGNNGTLTVSLASGSSTFKATGVLTDANGDLIKNATLTLTYPDGTQQTITNPLTTPAK